MNKFVKIIKTLNLIKEQDIKILNATSILNFAINENIYNFTISIKEPIPINLLNKITEIKHDGILIISSFVLDHEITIIDIISLLKIMFINSDDYNNFKKIINEDKINFENNIITFTYFLEEEINYLNKNKLEIIKVFKKMFNYELKDILFDKDNSIEEKIRISKIEKSELLKKEIEEQIKKKDKIKEIARKETELKGVITNLDSLTESQNNLTIMSKVFLKSVKDSQKVISIKLYIEDSNETFLIKYNIFKESLYENKSAIPLSFFDDINDGDWIKAVIDVKFDKFETEIYGLIKKIVKVETPKSLLREEDENEQRVELSVHTKMSAFDGISSVEDIFKHAKLFNNKSIGLTDRFNIQSFPEIQKVAKKYDIKPLYGFEIDIVSSDAKTVLNKREDKELKDATYIVYDLETTGLYPEFEDIIEFGGIKICNGIIIDKINFFIKPDKKISEKISEITSITNKDVENAINQLEGINKILDWIKDDILIAHNGNSFDFNFIIKKALKYNLPLPKNTCIDTLNIARGLYPSFKSHTLGKIATKIKVEYDASDAHRADYDAIVLSNVWTYFIKELEKINITTINQLDNIDQTLIRYRAQSNMVYIYAKDQDSLKWINELVSISSTTGFFKKPTLSFSDVDRFRKNIIIANSPIDGELFRKAIFESEDNLKQAISYYDYIFVSPPSTYIQETSNENLTVEQVENIIKKIIELSLKQNKKVIAVSNSYYINPEDKKYQYVYLHAKGLGGARHRYYRNKELPTTFIRNTKEMINEFKFLEDDELIKEIVIKNSNYFSDQISNDIKPIKDKLYTPSWPNVDKLLKEEVFINVKKRYGDKLSKIISDRLELELNAIINNRFSVIYWISHLLVKKSVDDGYVVGSRGSVGSSFVATMLKITDVNPLSPHYICDNCKYIEFNDIVDNGYDLKVTNCPECTNEMAGEGHNIPFETFLGFKCDKVPDIDLNFSGLYQAKAHNFIKEMFGEKHSFRAGTISTIAEKTAYGHVKSYFEEINSLSNKDSKILLYAKKCQDTKKTTGQHPGGILVIPKEYSIFDFTPYNFPADDVTQDWFTTHYAFEYLHDNLLKFDILGHDNPTILKHLKDLTGIDEKDIPNNDENVIKLFTSTEPLKILDRTCLNEESGVISLPEFGTPFVRQMLKQTKPESFSDLIRISGLSHGTDVYVGNAKSLIANQKLKLKDVIACRDDIMTYLISMGVDNLTSFKIMEDVRKGKKVKKEYEKIMLQNKVPQWYIDSCNKIKYMFPKAHATAYVQHAWKFAWYKIYYPLEYYATYFSTKIDTFDIETIVGGKNIILNKMNEIKSMLDNRETKNLVKKKEMDLLIIFEVVLEMISRGYEILAPDIFTSEANDFIIKDNAIICPFTVIDGLGDTVAETIIVSRNEKCFESIIDLKERTKINVNAFNILKKIGSLKNLPEDSQLKLFDF